MDTHVLSVYKNPGETPLECLEIARKVHPEFSHMPMTYAGRLDPMAEGVLLLLVGDECLKKDEYLNLPKEYEMTVLFGFATDTYDLLGKVVSVSESTDAEDKIFGPRISSPIDAPLEREVRPDRKILSSASVLSLLPRFSGKFEQKYPPYSSRTVEGKPLFKWAREGRLDEINIPTHEVFVDDIKLGEIYTIKGSELLPHIKKVISLVGGDFRQKEILDLWQETLKYLKEEEFSCATFTITCSSGTYVRAIAQELGEALGIPALAMKIVRTKLGEYTAKPEL